MAGFTIRPMGDQALVAEFGASIDEATNRRVHALAAWIGARRVPGIVELAPAHRPLLVCYDPAVISFARLKRPGAVSIRMWWPQPPRGGASSRCPVAMAARSARTLPAWKKSRGCPRRKSCASILPVDYRIYMLGFLPGFPYLGGLDKRIEASRHTQPALRRFHGFSGHQRQQTGVYPMESPGGWRSFRANAASARDPRSAVVFCMPTRRKFIRFIARFAEVADIQRRVAEGGCALRHLRKKEAKTHAADHPLPRALDHRTG